MALILFRDYMNKYRWHLVSGAEVLDTGGGYDTEAELYDYIHENYPKEQISWMKI